MLIDEFNLVDDQDGVLRRAAGFVEFGALTSNTPLNDMEDIGIAALIIKSNAYEEADGTKGTEADAADMAAYLMHAVATDNMDGQGMEQFLEGQFPARTARVYFGIREIFNTRSMAEKAEKLAAADDAVKQYFIASAIMDAHSVMEDLRGKKLDALVDVDDEGAVKLMSVRDVFMRVLDRQVDYVRPVVDTLKHPVPMLQKLFRERVEKIERHVGLDRDRTPAPAPGALAN